MNSPSANFTNSATTPHTNLLQQVSVYQTVNSFTGVYQTVNSFTGGSAREFVHARRGGLVAPAHHRMNSVSDMSNPLKRVALVGTRFARFWWLRP